MGDEVSIFEEALDIPSPVQRAAFLDQACAGNPELRQEVESLLAAHDAAGGFLNAPPAELAADTSDMSDARDAATDETKSELNERPGTMVGRYKLLEQIGEGGMGVVFMAEQTAPVRRRVAVKIIKPGLDTRQVIARFEAERQALAMMDHANIAKVLDAGATDAGRPYFVMELVRGIPITEYCDKQQLDPRQRLALFIQVCQALQHAHTKGIIHRDLKPTNVLVTQNEGRPSPKIIDFGIAKATVGQRLTDRTLFTEFRQLIGTPLYMSPEQAEMSAVMDVDTRSDVYSLGVLLYELLTGTTPFDKQRLAKAAFDEVRRILREEEPPRLSTRLSTVGATLATISANRGSDPKRLGQLMRGELDWIAMKALEKDRDRRYETPNDLARDVERYLADQPVEACPPARLYRFRKMVRRNKAAITTAAMVGIVLLLATAISTSQAVRASRATAAAKIDRDVALAEKARADEQRDRVVEEKRLVMAEKERADEQTKATAAVTDFLSEDVLGQASPDQQAIQGVVANPDLTVREALDRAAKLVVDRFIGQPLVEAGIRRMIGVAYYDLGQDAEAEYHLRWGLIRYRQVGEQLDLKIDTADMLSRVYERTEQYEKAEPLIREVYEDSRRAHGEHDRATLIRRERIGHLYTNRNEWFKATAFFLELLPEMQQAFGDQDVYTIMCKNNLAGCYFSTGHFAEGEKLFAEALPAAKRLPGGEQNPHALFILHNVAMCEFNRGEYAKAAPLFVQVIDGERHTLGPSHPETLYDICLLADTYDHLGKLREAEAQYEEAARWFESNPDRRLQDVSGTQVVAALIACYKRDGMPNKAEEWEQKLVSIQSAELVAKNKALASKQDIGVVDTIATLREPLDEQANGRFAEALDDALDAADVDPNDSDVLEVAACLHLYLGQVQDYLAARQLLISRFGDKDGDHPAKSCLLWPLSSADASALMATIDRAIALSPPHDSLQYFNSDKGMAAYRSGAYDDAVKYLTLGRDALTATIESRAAERESIWDEVRTTDDFFLAMAEHQLRNYQQARDRLLLAQEELRTHVPPPSARHGRLASTDWLMVQIVAREAELTVNGSGPPKTPVTTQPSMPATAPTAHGETRTIRLRELLKAGQFRQAAEAFAQRQKANPDNHWNWFRRGCLLAYLSDEDAYRADCDAMVKRFGQTNDLGIADRLMTIVLLLPAESGGRATPAVLKQLEAPYQVLNAYKPSSWSLQVQGMYQFRSGRYLEAIDLFSKSIASTNDVSCNAASELYLAMALHAVGKRETAAQAELRKGIEMIDNELPKLGEYLGPSFHEWIICQVALREARESFGLPGPMTLPSAESATKPATQPVTVTKQAPQPVTATKPGTRPVAATQSLAPQAVKSATTRAAVNR